MPAWLGPVPSAAWLVVLVLALAGLALTAYALRALDLRGAAASFLLGLVVALLGGLGWLLLMVAFTALGFAVTRIGRRQKQERRVMEGNGGQRGAKNVLANGSAATLAAVALLIDAVPATAAALAFATALAAVTADTMASEVGTLAARARRVLPPFQAMVPGENGGVSWLGQGAAAAGAVLIAVLAVPLGVLPWGLVWVPAAAGFLGCQLDSVLGATLEGDAVREGPLSKQDVNFIASTVPALVVLVAASLL